MSGSSTDTLDGRVETNSADEEKEDRRHHHHHHHHHHPHHNETSSSATFEVDINTLNKGTYTYDLYKPIQLSELTFVFTD